MTTELAQALVAGGARGTLGLTVLYDERCPLCRRLRHWLGGRPTLHPITFLPADSAAAHAAFPALDHARTTRVLTVVTSEGAVYEGERAWLVCGWTLPGWRPVAEHFSSGLRLHVARWAARAVDGYRHYLMPSAEPCAQCAVTSPIPKAPKR